MTFQLFTLVATYDNRDAIVGSRAIAHPYNFVTEAGAWAVAGIKEDRNRSCGGDDAYRVVPFGTSPYSSKAAMFWGDAPAADQDIPF